MSRIQFVFPVVLLIVALMMMPRSSGQDPKLTDQQRESLIDQRDTLVDEAFDRADQGELDAAQKLLDKVFQIETKIFGEHHIELIGTLDYQSRVADAAEDWRATIEFRRRACEIGKRLFPPDAYQRRDLQSELEEARANAIRTDQQRRLLQQADLANEEVLSLFEQQKFTDAFGLAQMVLSVREKVLGKEHVDYAQGLNNLANLYQSVGNYAQAEPLLTEATKILEKVVGKEHPDYANCLNSLASLKHSLGDFVGAEPLYVESREIREKVLGKEDATYAQSLNNLAELYRTLGEHARAEPLCLEAKEIRERVLGVEHPEYAQSLNNLAVLYEAMGDHARAAPLYTQAQEILRELVGKEHPSYAAILDNRARLYRALQDYQRAESLNIEAMKIRETVLGKQHRDYARSLINLAGLYRTTGKYARAEKHYVEATEILRDLVGPDHPDFATNLNNMAALYRDMGDFDRAKPLSVKALSIREKTLGKQHPDYALSLNNLAELHDSMGEYARAEPLYRQAIDITLNRLETIACVQSEQQQRVMGQSVRYQLDNYLLCTLQGELDPRHVIERLVLWKGSILRRGRDLRLASSDPDIAGPFQQLQSVASRLSAAIQAQPSPGSIEAWKTQVSALAEKKRLLEVTLSDRSTAFRSAIQPVRFEEIRESIPEEGVLVDYLEFGKEGDRSIAASIIPRHGKLTLLNLGSAEEVAESIDIWRNSFGASPRAKAAAEKLRDQLWEPLGRYVSGADLILVSTDGVLGRLPFVALPGKEPNTYLIEDHRLAMIPVPQLLPALVGRQNSGKLSHELLLVGDVDYESGRIAESSKEDRTEPPKRKPRPWERNRIADALRGDSNWGPLKETRAEVEFIRGLYQRLYNPEKDAIVDLRGSAATESAFRTLAPDCMLVHVATHGFFASPDANSTQTEEPDDRRKVRVKLPHSTAAMRGYRPGELSGLVFAGANHPIEFDPREDVTIDDGIMSADEIAFLPLGGVRLVVLSACETGLGEVAGGEGLIGIQRAFQIAGAHSTIATLWKVNDPATRRLMQEFYTKYLSDELSVLDALRETQLWAIDHPADVPRGVGGATQDLPTNTAQRTEPIYWAPFVLSGDWR